MNYMAFNILLMMLSYEVVSSIGGIYVPHKLVLRLLIWRSKLIFKCDYTYINFMYKIIGFIVT